MLKWFKRFTESKKAESDLNQVERLKILLRRWISQDSRVWITASSVTGFMIILRLTGGLQPLEWSALDQLFRLRPADTFDQRILIVTIDEPDLKRIGAWPIPDRTMAELLLKLYAAKPHAIGLDIYRNLPVPPGNADLRQAFDRIPNVIGIEALANDARAQVPAPPILARKDQVGVNNVVVDSDGVVRRNTLYWRTAEGKLYKSWALKLSLLYLDAVGIEAQPAVDDSDYLQLGAATFYPLNPNDGPYVHTDTRGYQILANFRGKSGKFPTVSLTDVLSDRVSPDLIRDRIVLIGSTAVSLKDFFSTPHSRPLMGHIEQISGVELQANFISQILSAAIEGQPLMRFWSPAMGWIWIFAWSYSGAALAGQIRSLEKLGLSMFIAGTSLGIVCYGAFLWGWWVPSVPTSMAFIGSVTAITAQTVYREQKLRKSKEFLDSVINAVPDPIFVKDEHHRWIAVNQACTQFMGQPAEFLLEKTDSNLFPEDQAAIFKQQDAKVFQTGKAREHEETFTNANGTTYLVATKRSIHEDADGNRFLVGVIRDMTERKQMEAELKQAADELKQTTSELIRSNTELKLSEDRLRHMAHHDALTGLPNRHLFHNHFRQAIEQATRENHQVALLFVDLDGFKNINDTLGHQVGDQLLQAVARRLVGGLRDTDIVSRLGGDEFTVILPGVPGLQDVVRVAEKLLETLSKSFVLEGKTVAITASIGISLYPLHGREIEILIKTADSAMYCAKDLGKSRYMLSSPAA
ncbi:MAG: CHASE2 domain-containing protein [Cyanothece sp. SIO1E1]|nr:CHASE2 domain-containing protein [Cyanothece sp. SIO1E1]